MTEKTAIINRPALAILAGTPKALMDYLAQIASVAGWDVAEEGFRVKVMTSDHVIDFDMHGNVTSFKIPVKAFKIIQYLQAVTKQSGGGKIAIGTYTLHPQDYILVDGQEQAIRLTEKEAAILVCLSRQNGKPMSRQALLDDVWAYAEGVETHTLETHIYRLRQKIELDPSEPKIIQTLEDGYFLSQDQ